jgi:phage tail-like protein
MTDAQAGAPADQITAARFSLSIDGVEIGQFADLGAITSELELPEIQKEPGGKKLPRRIPPTVTLSRGMNQDLSIFAWHQVVVEGQFLAARKNCSLIMYSASGTPVARYYLKGAWPSKVGISALKSGANEILIETVTLVAENIQRVAP